MVPVALSCARLLIVLLPCDARQNFDDVAVGEQGAEGEQTLAERPMDKHARHDHMQHGLE